MVARLRTALPALIGLALFLAALEVLRTELRAVTWHGLTTDLLNIPGGLLLAMVLTAVNYGDRQALHRLEREQATFRVIPREHVPAVMDQLRTVSDDWLGHRAGAEKGFSLGFFDPQYVARFAVAVVEHGGRIVAFANVWEGPRRVELSVDLMRYDRRAPRDVMDALFVHVMLWGKAQGYRWFPLGMAPLSGFESSPVAPLWARLASFLYEHGEAV